MKTLLVGAGAIARQHLAALQRIERVDRIHLCDRSPVTARAMAERFDLTDWSSDFAEALDSFSPDVVHVTTPPSSHVGLTRQALAAGCHVIVEKPASPTRDELTDVLDEATRRDLTVVEDFNYLFNPGIRQLLDDVSAGRYGQLVHVSVTLALDIYGEGSPFLDPALNGSFRHARGGPVADFLPHLASLAHAFVGRHTEVQAIWGSSSAPNPYAVDTVRALVQGEHATASIGFSPVAQPDLFSIVVEGTKQRSQTNVFEGRSTRERQRAMAKPLVPLANGLDEGLAVASGSLRAFATKLSGGPGAYSGLRDLVGRFYGSVALGTPPPVTPDQMLAVADLVHDVTEGAA